MGEAMRRQEAERSNAQGRMVMKAPPVASFVMRQAKLLFEFPVIALNAPAHLGDKDQMVDGGVCRSRREPIMIGSLCLFGPFDQQPLFRAQFARQVRVMRRPDSHTGKTRSQRCICAFAPGDLLPDIGRQTLGDLDNTDGFVTRRTTKQFGFGPAPAPGFGRQGFVAEGQYPRRRYPGSVPRGSTHGWR